MVDRIIGPTAEPTMSDLMEKTKRDVFLTLNCVQVGTIEAYSPTLNTATVSINFKRVTVTGTEITYPLLMDCPVVILSGGLCNITFPISKGDECLVLFNDRNIDDWWYSGEIKPPADGRAHSMSDSLILVGIRNKVRASALATPTGSLCINGGDKKVAIKNAVNDLKTLMSSLIDAISNLATLPCANGAPTALDATTKAALASIKTNFGLLLDEGAT